MFFILIYAIDIYQDVYYTAVKEGWLGKNELDFIDY